MATNKEALKEHLLKYGFELVGQTKNGEDILHKNRKYNVYNYLVLYENRAVQYYNIAKRKSGELVPTGTSSHQIEYSKADLCENLDQTKGTLRITEVVEL